MTDVPRILTAAEYEEVDELYNQVFSWKPVPLGYSTWRYGKGRGRCIGLRNVSGKLIASHGLQIFTFSPTLGAGALSVDVMVHPDHQRKGLGRLLDSCARVEAESMGCSFLMCFPNPKLKSMRSSERDWLTVGRSAAYILDVSEFDKEESVLSSGACTLSKIPPVESMNLSPDVGFLRHWKFYSRFIKHPVYRYEWVRVYKQGYTACAMIKMWNKSQGDIVDIIGDDAAVVPTVSAAVRRLMALGAKTVSIWAPLGLAGRPIESLGFQKDDERSRPIQVCEFEDEDNPVSFSWADWHLTQADTDLY